MERETKDLIKRCKELPYSNIGKQLTIDEAIYIWKSLGYFIRNGICENKTVIIPKIGKFYLKRSQIPVAHNPPRYFCTCTPVFEVSNRLVSHFRMRASSRHGHKCNYPQVSLNPSTVAILSHQRRSAAVDCFREVLAYLQRCLAANVVAKLPIEGVGTLMFKDGEAHMNFDYKLLREVEEKGTVREIYDS